MPYVIGKVWCWACARVRSKSKGSLSGNVEWRGFGYGHCHSCIVTSFIVLLVYELGSTN